MELRDITTKVKISRFSQFFLFVVLALFCGESLLRNALAMRSGGTPVIVGAG